MPEKKKKGNVFKGTLTVGMHAVTFWYDIGRHKLTERLKSALTEEAQLRAEYLWAGGYGEGELNCLCAGKSEIRGWVNLK